MIDAETASAAKAGANLLENKLGKKVVNCKKCFWTFFPPAKRHWITPKKIWNCRQLKA